MNVFIWKKKFKRKKIKILIWNKKFIIIIIIFKR